MTNILLFEEAEGIVTLTLNDPKTLNSLSDAMLAALKARLEQTAADPDVRCVVLSGAGRAFCAGHDLREIQAARQAED